VVLWGVTIGGEREVMSSVEITRAQAMTFGGSERRCVVI